MSGLQSDTYFDGNFRDEVEAISKSKRHHFCLGKNKRVRLRAEGVEIHYELHKRALCSQAGNFADNRFSAAAVTFFNSPADTSCRADAARSRGRG